MFNLMKPDMLLSRLSDVYKIIPNNCVILNQHYQG